MAVKGTTKDTKDTKESTKKSAFFGRLSSCAFLRVLRVLRGAFTPFLRGAFDRPGSRHYHLRRRAFTLIELLVVVSILALLAGLLLPVFARVRESARQAVCRSQMRQIGMALNMYRQDFGAIPPRLSTVHPAYVRDARLFVCPSDPLSGRHDGNEFLEGNRNIATGMSYDYLPNWRHAWSAGWWNPPPRSGLGKWGDLTPISECPWHWARHFDKHAQANRIGSRGWMFVLTAGGSVRRRRVEEPLAAFTPDRYR